MRINKSTQRHVNFPYMSCKSYLNFIKESKSVVIKVKVSIKMQIKAKLNMNQSKKLSYQLLMKETN